MLSEEEDQRVHARREAKFQRMLDTMTRADSDGDGILTKQVSTQYCHAGMH
jgi:hypothetical protein